MNKSPVKQLQKNTKPAPTKQKILEIAYTLFTKRGYLGSTTQSIAREAGVNEVTIFRLFGTKQKLFSAVLDEFVISRGILALNEVALFKKHSGDPHSFFKELAYFICLHFKETIPFMKAQMLECNSEQLDEDVLDRLAQIPLTAKNKIEDIFKQCAVAGWIQKRDSYDSLFISLYGPFLAYLMNKNKFNNKVFKEPEEKMIEEIIQNFVQGCLLKTAS
jgi:AcrR family transcriptional regulator